MQEIIFELTLPNNSTMIGTIKLELHSNSIQVKLLDFITIHWFELTKVENYKVLTVIFPVCGQWNIHTGLGAFLNIYQLIFC